MRTHARLDNAKIQRDEGRLHLNCALQHLLTVQKNAQLFCKYWASQR